ncbi:MAG: SPOR domain-containing protein [Candidatus Marinimicrobia bacterium]|nr:SPOR domain-containing protein [Candidatus Neomarinimicrobiota bacterium]MCF7839255.1 SPOR domain-containing protein [Candidatus Neomarinimicrobiota bacterium]MCF7902213.1 SPOR domain-containing protein [Candidatus Neomarinimicrobiota bacterium]
MSRVKILVLSATIAIVLSGCDLWNKYMGREDVALGEYITVEHSGPGSARWTFTAFPDSSTLTPNDILPSDTSLIISFLPDVPGKYDFQLAINSDGAIDLKNFYYSVEMPASGELVLSEIPDHLKVYLNTRDTLDSLGLNSAGNGRDTNQRSYLDKVVSPKEYTAMQTKHDTQPAAKSKPAAKPKPTMRKKSTPTRPTASSSEPNRGNLVPRANKSFTIQISSWESLEEAQAAVKSLRGTYGLEGYIQRVFFKDTDQVFYRVRVGNYKTYSEAKAAAKDVQRTTNFPVWVDYVRKEM